MSSPIVTEGQDWGVWIDRDGKWSEPHWYLDHKGNPKPFTESYARAMVDTLNRGEMSGVCEARKLVPNWKCPTCQRTDPRAGVTWGCPDCYRKMMGGYAE